jgi:hypothetical protein
VLNAASVWDDGVADTLVGGTELDWFLRFPGDRLLDRTADETVTSF